MTSKRDTVLQRFYDAMDHKDYVKADEYAETYRGLLHHDLARPSVVECPLCGKKLVVRTGKYGAFFGCEAYPECTYTRSLRKVSLSN